MTRAQIFAVGHSVGTAIGVASGTLLPWWASGVGPWAAWALASVAALAFRRRLAAVIYERPANFPQIRQSVEFGRSVRVWWRHGATGLLWGGLAGAACADAAEVADLLLWPGHDSTPAVAAAIGVTLGWTVASVAVDPYPRDVRMRPMLVGLALYVAAVVMAAASILRGAW